MILQWIDSLESLLANLIGLLIQLLYLCALLICCVGVATIICLPFIAVYWHYLDRKKANAKRNPPSEPTAIAEADPVKGRAPRLVRTRSTVRTNGGTGRANP